MHTRRHYTRQSMLSVLGAVALVSACSTDAATGVQPTELAVGSWGNEGVGVIVGEAMTHVHVGCTKGDFPAPIILDSDQRFSVSGSYLIKAYPVAIGPTMPAEFTGVVDGNQLTFTVAVNDTIDQTLEVLGPSIAVFGQEPEMGPCPICRTPDSETIALQLCDQQTAITSRTPGIALAFQRSLSYWNGACTL